MMFMMMLVDGVVLLSSQVLNNLKFNIHSDHIIIILTLGCGLLGGMCFAMCFNCIRKLIRDGRQIHVRNKWMKDVLL